jgi:hypothetical protein
MGFRDPIDLVWLDQSDTRVSAATGTVLSTGDEIRVVR